MSTPSKRARRRSSVGGDGVLVSKSKATTKASKKEKASEGGVALSADSDARPSPGAAPQAPPTLSSYDASSKPTHSSSAQDAEGSSVFLLPLHLVMALLLWLHDQYYFFIQWLCSPICRVIPRTVFGYTVFTANSVTYARTLMVVIIAGAMKFGYNEWACFLIMYHDFLDHVDGVVAKVQRENGLAKDDDGTWGAFIDAFCDKIVFCLTLWTALLLVDYSSLPLVWVGPVVVSASALLAYEFAIGVVRVSDYFHVTLSPPSVNGDKKSLALRAVMEGKLKQKLESVGMALLALILPTPASQPTVLFWACFCLFAAIYMAHQSLAHKLRAWKEFKAA